MKFIGQFDKRSFVQEPFVVHHKIQKMQESEKEADSQICQSEEVSYDQACQMYKHYKSLTLKQHMYDNDFQYNLRMREHFLAIKKRHDMRRRAKKFRDKQKKEVARLRNIA